VTVDRIAYVCADRGIAFDGHKGASIHVREMVQAFRRADIEVGVFVRRASKGPTDGIHAHVAARRPSPESADPGSAEGWEELLELADQSSLLDALETSPHPDLVYERASLFGLMGLAHARRCGVPFVLEVNAPLWEEAKKFRSLRLGELAEGVARTLFRESDLVLAVSSRLRSRILAEGGDPARVHVFANGVSRAFIEDRHTAVIPRRLGQRPVVAFIGSLKPWHGVDLLLESFCDRADEHDAALWIVGDGPLRERVQAAQQSMPDRIYWDGAVDHEQIPAILRASVATVAPYPASCPDYFCPLKVVEATAAGVPLIAASVSAVRDTVPRPDVVHWFEPDSLNGLVRAIRDVTARATIARAEAESVRREIGVSLGWDARVQALRKLVEQIPKNGSRTEVLPS
jgi:glycosyltransferase involved in cell wall biosynthesis